MDFRGFKEELQSLIKGRILVEEPMGRHTTWKIGGPAEVMVIPNGVEEIVIALKLANKYKIPFYTIGNGSNLLVKDKGLQGLVIKLASEKNNIFCDGEEIVADAGAKLPVLARVACDHSLAGLEFAVGIPASVGGATMMNAGAHGGCMADVVKEVTALQQDGEKITIKRNEAGFAYRTSIFKEKNLLIVSVTFLLKGGSEADIKARMKEYLEKRREMQPVSLPNAGSVFKNPPGESAGKLIDMAGCKGLRCGGAEISHKHANFILNVGDATAADVLQLMTDVSRRVYEKFNIELEPEVQVIGE